MELDRLLAFFATSPSVRLLRSPHAPYILHFLDATFKESGQITWPHSELAARLTTFQDNIHADGSDALRDRAEAYLTDWTSGDSRWLARRLEAGVNEPVYELSPHTEVVLRFLREVLQKRLGFVGTESRLRRIIETLSSLVIRGSDDPTKRLEHLRAERNRIDAEIQAIETDGVVSTFSPTAIRERFADAVEDLVHLQSDFRAVEESFKQITRAVQRRQSETTDSRGEILGYALDAEESLKTEDQGVSFHEFVRLILSPTKQEELERIIAGLDEIQELADQLDGLRRIHGMVPSLLAESQKVLKTTQRLSTTLRRLLDTRAAAGRMRLAKLLRDIRQTASRLAENPPTDKVSLQVENDLEIVNISERTFWTPPVQFAATEMYEAKPDEDDRLAAFKTLALMRRLDWSAMRRKVHIALSKRDRLSLTELFEHDPPEGGVIEVLGFLQIAHDDGHEVDTEQTDIIQLKMDDYAELLDNPSMLSQWGSVRVADSDGLELDAIEPEDEFARDRVLELEIPRVIFHKRAGVNS